MKAVNHYLIIDMIKEEPKVGGLILTEQTDEVNRYIIVDRIKTGPKKVAGLIMTENIDEDSRYSKAKIISTGNLVEGLKDGDIIYYDKHAGHGIQHKDKFYGVIKQQDVVLID